MEVPIGVEAYTVENSNTKQVYPVYDGACFHVGAEIHSPYSHRFAAHNPTAGVLTQYLSDIGANFFRRAVPV